MNINLLKKLPLKFKLCRQRKKEYMSDLGQFYWYGKCICHYQLAELKWYFVGCVIFFLASTPGFGSKITLQFKLKKEKFSYVERRFISL